MQGFAITDINKSHWLLHYALAPIMGEWILPWDELSEELRRSAGHQGRVHAIQFPEQWRSDRVYVHELLIGSTLDIGVSYSNDPCWIYEVEAIGLLTLDPERGGHLPSSRICKRARVIQCVHYPPS